MKKILVLAMALVLSVGVASAQVDNPKAKETKGAAKTEKSATAATSKDGKTCDSSGKSCCKDKSAKKECTDAKKATDKK